MRALSCAAVLVAVLSAQPVVAQTLPAGWSSIDIGQVGVAGDASGSGGTFTVQGAGADIWGSADAFHFVYQPLTGDGTIVARVVSLDHTHHWAKAGVMLRDTTAPGSRHAAMIVSAARGLAFQRRVRDGGLSTHTSGGDAAAPHWVRLVRNGDTFTAQTSADGAAWRTVGIERIEMGQTIHAGLAVTSHDSNAAATARFDQVALSTTAEVTLAREPFLQQVTSNSAVVVWTTTTSASGEVRYWRSDGATATAPATTTFYPASGTDLGYDYYQHEARLTSLFAETTYGYDVFVDGDRATAGTDRFRTAPVPGTGTVRFIAFGDSGTGSTAQRQLASLMEAESFDLAVHTGDVVYGNSGGTGDGTYRTLNDWFFRIYERWLRRAPMFPSLGNHDSRASTGHGVFYFDSFVLPENGASSAYPDHAERYYSFDYGPVHFVALDTELALQDAGRRAEQLAWLDADLAATPQPWKVAYFHRSPYGAGTHHGSDLAVREAFAPLFEKHGVQLVLSAHDHMYERTWPIPLDAPAGQGVVYVITGGGGAPLYATGTAAWTAHAASVHHYVRAAATPCVLTLEAVGLTGAVFDEVTLDRCGGGEGPGRGWSSQDIGPVGVAGSISESGGTMTVRGAGADIWGRSDAFHYAYRPLTGDGTIVARVASLSGPHAWTKVGVMLRASTAPDAAHAFMLVSRDRGLAFQRRTTAGGLSTHTSGGSGTAPRWVRLTRAGNVFTAAVSSDGASWTVVGSDTIPMPATILAGLAVTSHDATSLATGDIDGISISETAALPDGWSSQDIGPVGVAGAASENGGTVMVSGAGADIWGRSDAFHYAHRPLTGDGTIVARVASLSGPHVWTKVGVMLRASTAPDAAHAFMLVSRDRGLAFQRRTTAGGLSTHTSGGSGTAPRWVRLTRAGDVFTAAVSSDGASWTVVGSDTIPMPATILAGLAVTSHDATSLATGGLDGVHVSP